MALLSVIRRWHFREGMPIREIELRIPTKSVTDSDLNPAMCSDLKSARIPI